MEVVINFPMTVGYISIEQQIYNIYWSNLQSIVYASCMCFIIKKNKLLNDNELNNLRNTTYSNYSWNKQDHRPIAWSINKILPSW